MRQTAADDLERLGELLHAACETDTEEPDLDRRDAAADAEQKAPSAHLVEHADLVDQAQRVIERQQIHHWPEPDLPRPLRDRGQEDTGRRGIAERRVVVLGEMVAVEPGAVIGLDQLEPLLEELADGHAVIVQMIKDPKAHFVVPGAGTPQQLVPPYLGLALTTRPFRIASVRRPSEESEIPGSARRSSRRALPRSSTDQPRGTTGCDDDDQEIAGLALHNLGLRAAMGTAGRLDQGRGDD